MHFSRELGWCCRVMLTVVKVKPKRKRKKTTTTFVFTWNEHIFVCRFQSCSIYIYEFHFYVIFVCYFLHFAFVCYYFMNSKRSRHSFSLFLSLDFSFSILQSENVNFIMADGQISFILNFQIVHSANGVCVRVFFFETPTAHAVHLNSTVVDAVDAVVAHFNF